jgi:hypothetical protein
MSGRRHRIDATGSSYENCVQLLLGRVASLVRVPREQDFGIDFYCQPRVVDSAHTETVTDLAAVQVKGGQERLNYGGLDRLGRWREYQFSWLRSLAVPLYLARVNQRLTTVELFSLWPLWLIFWSQAVLPFEVIFLPGGANDGGEKWRMPEPRTSRSGVGRGDGLRWTVHLGKPFLRLTSDELTKDDTLRSIGATLRTWIATDRLTVMRLQQFIPVVTGITEWETNRPEGQQTRTWQFWNRTPGANIDRLCRTAAPMFVNLGAHLQWQDDGSAYALIPVLEWLEARHQLDEIGVGLLNGLRKAKSRGVGPASSVPAQSKQMEARKRSNSIRRGRLKSTRRS